MPKNPTGQKPFLGTGPRTPTGSGPDIDAILEQERFNKAPRHVQEKMIKEAGEKAEAAKKAAKKAAEKGSKKAGTTAADRAAKAALEKAEDELDDAIIRATRAFQKTGKKEVYEKIVKKAAEKVARVAAKVGARHAALAPLGPHGQAAGVAMDVGDLVSMFMDAVPSKEEEAKADKRDRERQNRRLAAKQKRWKKQGAVGLPESPALSQTDDPGE